MLQMNRSGMVTMIMFIWAHLVGPEQLHGIQISPAEHIIKILMFKWNFQMISKETDRWPHVDERVAIVQPSVDHQDLNILFRTHPDLKFVKKIYRTEDFRVKNLHRKRVIFDIC